MSPYHLEQEWRARQEEAERIREKDPYHEFPYSPWRSSEYDRALNAQHEAYARLEYARNEEQRRRADYENTQKEIANLKEEILSLRGRE